MTEGLSSQELLRKQILEICCKEYRSLGDICRIVNKSKNTIQAGYIYPMVKDGLLMRELPAGTKSSQRYIAAKRR